MVRGMFRSRTFRRVSIRTAKGSKTVYKKRRPSPATCSVTGEILKGVPRASPTKLKNMAKSKKRPSRPFGGVLSSKAAREVIKARARQKQL
jgi:large subunit ribosomal protein L34e